MIRKTGLALTVALMGATAAIAVDHHGEKEDGNSAIAHALASEKRQDSDRASDAARKPQKMLKFTGIGAGMTVLDINSSSGYYAELFSSLVGAKGKVIAHNGPAYWAFMKETLSPRYNGDHLGNVVQIHDGNEAIDLPEGSVDVAFSGLAYHDYFMNAEAVSDPTVMTAVNTSIYKALKPGGVYVLVDHHAPAGSGAAAGGTLHRIDPAIVREQLEAVGFSLIEEADFLVNPDDPMTTGPFDPAIRGKTSRFIYKFQK